MTLNRAANLLVELARRLDAVLSLISSDVWQQASRDHRDLMRDVDDMLYSATDDFLMSYTIIEALLSLEGRADSKQYREWLVAYHAAGKALDAEIAQSM
jgi:hypothetical protein